MSDMQQDVPHPGFFAVDFYCGAGGTTRGMIDAGGYVIAGIDKDETCWKTYVRNNSNTSLDREPPQYLALDMFEASDDYPEGQQQEVWEQLRRLIPQFRNRFPNLPLMFAICAPCQSFTKFVQRNMTEKRSETRMRDQNLLAQTLDFIDEFEPELVMSENVASIKTGRLRHVWQDFRNSLILMGYDVDDRRVCASNFGIPQRRRRSILIAIKRQELRRQEQPVLIPEQDVDAELQTVQQAIDHLPSLDPGDESMDVPNHVCRNLTELNRKRLMALQPGEPNFNLANSDFGDLSLDCHRRLEAKGKRGFGDVYTRMRPDRPSPTITTRFHSVSNGRFGHYAPQQVRAISLREGAALQSFSDDYQFYGTGMDPIARMIGNAVPPVLARFMSQWAVNQWQERSHA
ncbi:MAG: DNA cytosine methyltransferase [Chloroflexi bacterium]|nr:DNA cytosine methyltransferase [Chloroflexota bacterium]